MYSIVEVIIVWLDGDFVEMRESNNKIIYRVKDIWFVDVILVYILVNKLFGW